MRLASLVLVGTLLAADGHAAETLIAFGSCSRQYQTMPAWPVIAARRPAAVLLLGDNVYADTADETTMRACYARLNADAGFSALRASTRLLATWDDHDYGENDGGADFVAKAMAQRVFCDVWDIPPGHPRRTRAGIFDAVVLGEAPQRVQVILLDTRFNRSPLKSVPKAQRQAGRGPCLADPDPAATVLGAEQEAWLAQQLQIPAELRLVCSSIQVLPDEHGYETWGNFPQARLRLLATLATADGVVLLSGDRHHGEASCVTDALQPGAKPPPYPLWELTSSSLNAPRTVTGEPNRVRRGGFFPQVNFGEVAVAWDAPEPALHLVLRSANNGQILQDLSVRLADLRR